MNELTVYEAMQVAKINEWKNEEPGVIAQGLAALMSPFAKLVDIVVPQSALEGALKACNGAGEFLADEGDILRDGGVKTIEELRKKDLVLSDQMANEVHNWAIGMATAEGAAVGTMGGAGIAIDIPVLMTFSLRTIHKIGLCYGYKADTDEEKQYVLQILSAVGSNSLKEKQVALYQLATLKNALKVPWSKMVKDNAAQALLLLIRQLCRQMGVNLTKRKAMQIIPIIGGLVGAAINGNFIRDLGYGAIRSYQERWLTDNDKWRDVG